MIEVEKKFHATEQQLTLLLEGAEQLYEKENIDIFFDLPDYTLTKKWMWLRERNGRMELKSATHPPLDGKLCETFNEFETDEEIREQLELPTVSESLLDQLLRLGYSPFAALHTHRKAFRNDKFVIDVDHTTGPEFEYDVVEIEQMVESEDEVKRASDEIDAFAESKGLATTHVNGKLLEFIERMNPEQFQILIETGYRKPD